MDYTKQSSLFKLRKAARYARLYGLGRTLVKIRAEYHMHRDPQDVRPVRRTPTGKQHVGILGCGKFAYAQIAYYLRKAQGPVIRTVMDKNGHRACSLARRYGAARGSDDPAAVLDDPRIDLVYIASNHASHAEYAITALSRGKHVHIEKPHVVTMDQLQRLCRAMGSSPAGVNLGFNRPLSTPGRAIHEALADQGGAAMMNWFIAGHELPPDHWYFRPEEGGRVIGNLCHWTDFVLQMIPPERRHPITIRPTRVGGLDPDIAVTYVFGDGSIGAITFSAKGHTFEGVRERFAAHKGDALIRLDDFKTLTIETGARKRTTKLRHRDHGQRASILAAYELATGTGAGAATRYVWETGELFLKTREAVESGEVVTVEAFAPERLESERIEAAS